ncbi:MAG: pyruvate:ferredoxin (flavodoxin) oxidoreductase [Spirochaetes bacterium]|nr:pyruvate:ferredoxin (flavodoxin) oxidoreductase [Spirochaetota bacterium]
MVKNYITIDGNTAATHVAYAFSEVAAIYPITPSSMMGELADAWSSQGRKNIFDQKLQVVELQSEGGASGAVHGSLSAGAITTTFTASQGLMLMLPNMHKIAGELLPSVFHVSARSLACQSLSIFGDHSDVMSARNTGWALMAAGSIQEVMDLAVVSHLATMKAKIPFLNFFDGFRTSNEVQKVEMIGYDTMTELVEIKYIEDFRKRALNPENPFLKVGAENPDVYFQGREASNKYYLKIPGIVQEYMDKVGKKIGRKYKLFDYVGAPDAEKIIIAMGSATETIEETVNYLLKKKEKVGLIKVRLYRPFSIDALLEAIPKTVKKIAVLDRTKEPGSIGEPLYMDITAAVNCRDIKVIGGRYGLSSKEFTPTMVKAVYDHLDGKCTHNFTVGIRDDVTNLSLELGEKIDTELEGVVRCKFWGYGSDGTVGANKNSIKIIGDNTDMFAQGYFQYDSKKSGGITISHLRFGKEKIQSQYLLEHVNFVALHKESYIGRYDILENILDKGTFLLNSEWKKEEVFENLSKDMQKTIIDKKIKVYNINANKIAIDVGLGNRINAIMQAAFFKLSGVLPAEKAIKLIKDAIKKTYGDKGENIVKMNWDAVDKTIKAIEEIKVPSKITKSAKPVRLVPADAKGFIKDVIEPAMRFKGDLIPVSAMTEDGCVPTGTTSLEKRGVALTVPKWKPENCIQCTFCSLVCPHGTIRPKQINPKDLKNAPKDFTTIKSSSKNDKDLQYRIQVYPEDCVGCGLCADECPAKEKALVMVPLEESRKAGETEKAEFFDKLPYNVTEGTNPNTIKGSQLLRPLFEFHGACAGCGEAAYIKLATQLYGDRMIIANATGCSSIYGGTFPTVPYCQNDKAHGPAWANSLFEDNAEYGYGMRLAVDANRSQLSYNIDLLLKEGTTKELTDALKKTKELWNSVEDDAKANAAKIKKLLPKALKEAKNKKSENTIKKIIELENYIIKKSVWAIGGDGWAYDIGYGGLDHVLASGRNINVLVLDTEVYSNTGGQSSKATPIAARAKFAEAGKETSKKDLGLMLTTYGYIYVATCSMGANKNQVLKAMLEAESYDGPSIIIAYSPCIAHGIDMSKTLHNQKRAVESGHFPLFRYDPRLAQEGKNPLQLDSKNIKIEYNDYISKETRFKSLEKLYPDRAKILYKKAAENAKVHFDYIKKLSEL